MKSDVLSSSMRYPTDRKNPGMSKSIRLVSAALVLTLSHSAWSVTYRWVDENGVVNYSERKPRNVAESRVTQIGESKPASSRRASQNTMAMSNTTRPTQPAAASDAKPDLSEDQQAMLRQLEAAEAERQAQLTRIRQDNCERSRRVLANLSASGRIRLKADDGAEQVLPEEERQQRIAEAQQGIVKNCDA